MTEQQRLEVLLFSLFHGPDEREPDEKYSRAAQTIISVGYRRCGQGCPEAERARAEEKA